MNWREFQRKQQLVQWGDRFLSFIDAGQGAPVVLLHGIPTWSYLWHPTIQYLQDGYRVLAPDMPGFGFSDKRDGFDRSIAMQAEAILAFLNALEIDSAHLIAHDIGGGVAQRLAVFHPERVRSLCLMNSVCYDSWPIELMLQLSNPETARRLSASLAMKMLRRALKMGFANPPSDEWLEGLLAPYQTEVGKLSLIRNAAALNTNLTVELTAQLPRVTIPALILWGEEDSFQLVRYGERLALDLPRSRLIRLPQAKHFVMIDQPALVHEHLGTFLETLRPGQLKAA
ncbi:MAG: alpha/beta hydrolase [Verrucomicrobiota bacterium]